MSEKKFSEPKAFEQGHCPDIAMALVESSQIACIGHCSKTNTLAVQFKNGTGHIYHYPDVSADTHAKFMSAESKGAFFKQHIRPLAFKKYPAPAKPHGSAAPA